MKRLSLYWICQIIGWGTAAIYWSLYQVLGAESIFLGTISVLLVLIAGIGSTHFYKRLAHKYDWVELDLLRLFPRLVLAVFLLSASYLLVSLSAITWVFGPQSENSILGMLTGGVRYMAIWLLAFHLYHIAGSRRKAELDQKRFENLALSAKYDKLNAELNPHFLFNALNSIKALILEDKDKARTAVDTLSVMLRNSLRLTDKVTIPLPEELERIKAYIDLEKIRFEERLVVDFDVPDDVLIYNIPPLSIYNLVENAIIHGLDKQKNGVKIGIAIKKKDDALQIFVKSNTSLREGWSFGKGLTNIKERLALIYREKASLYVSEENGNVISGIQIPIEP